MHNRSKAHWEAIKLILRYLKGSPEIDLVFDQHRPDPRSVVRYVDADYGGDVNRRTSLSAYILHFVVLLSVGILHFKPLRLFLLLKQNILLPLKE